MSLDGKDEKLYLQQKGSEQKCLGNYAYGDVFEVILDRARDRRALKSLIR